MKKLSKIILTPLEKTAVFVPAQKKYNVLMQVYEAGSWKWCNGYLPTKDNCWKDYKEETCVDMGMNFITKKEVGVGYGNREFYNEQNYNIISVKKFYEMQKITNKTLKELENWFEEYKPNRKSKGN